MIKVNVAEIKKHLTGNKSLLFDVEPAELDISEEDLNVDGLIHITGEISNAGDVLLLQARVSAMVERTCSRCLKEFTAESFADVVEKYYPSGSPGVDHPCSCDTGTIDPRLAALKQFIKY